MKETYRLAHSKIPNFRERLELLISKLSRPIMSGEIACGIGCSLAHVEREMNELIDAGFYRLATVKELKERFMDCRVIAYLRS